jgi:hypothetical protein
MVRHSNALDRSKNDHSKPGLVWLSDVDCINNKYEGILFCFGMVPYHSKAGQKVQFSNNFGICKLGILMFAVIPCLGLELLISTITFFKVFLGKLPIKD